MKLHNRFSKMVVLVLLLFGISITFFSCKHDRQVVPCNTPDAVSFSGNVLPIFNTYCNYAGCHSGGKPGGHLNLVDSVAYAQLMKSGSGNIDTINPAYSVLYTSMIASSNVPMPPSGVLDSCKVSLILKWIKQGAKNN